MGAMAEHMAGKRAEPMGMEGWVPSAGAPIGVFDSGVGGLTILAELLRELPGERYVYFGDTGNCPYGVRSVEEIQDLSAQFFTWQRDIEPTLPEEDRLFSTQASNGKFVWVIEDAQAITVMYPEEY